MNNQHSEFLADSNITLNKCYSELISIWSLLYDNAANDYEKSAVDRLDLVLTQIANASSELEKSARILEGGM